MNERSIVKRTNSFVNRLNVSKKNNLPKRRHHCALIAALVVTIGLVYSLNNPTFEIADAEHVEICDRTKAVANAIVAEIQKTREEATCADVTESELASIDGTLTLAPTALRSGDFSGLSKLRGIDIDGGTINLLRSETFLGLDNLNRLTVNTDSITTIHSGAFDGLNRLRSIHLHDDNIKAVPRDLFQGLDNLESLLLHGDGISSLPIGLFEGLERLRVLDLHTDSVIGLSDGVLTGMPNLRSLHYRNKNTGVLNTGVFRGLSRLEFLALEGSGITEIGSQPFAGLSNLRRLHLNGNNITSLPETIFQDVPNLRLLHLHGNSIENFPSGTLQGLSQLQQLYLHGNSITEIPNDIFRDLRNVRELHLHDNQVETLPADLFAGLTNLQELFLHNNKLTDISDLDLSDQTVLTWFNVEGNMLTTLPDVLFTSMPCSLEVMAIGANPFEGMPSTTIDGTEYKLLDVLPQPTTPGCRDTDGLTDLYIHDFPLSDEDLAKVRDNFVRLERLTIGNTGISSDAALDIMMNGNFENLIGLGLESNDLSNWNSQAAETLGSVFERHQELIALDMGETGIDGEVALTILENANPELQRFSFSDNDLSSWNDPDAKTRLTEAFARLPKSRWTVILLENTMIDDTVAEAILPAIATSIGDNQGVVVNLSGNQITRIDAQWFEEWEVLKRLYLSNNQIVSIDPEVLAPVADHLTTLHLDGNPIDPIPTREDFEAVLPNLEELELPDTTPVSTPVATERLPRTGGNAPPENAALLLLILGAAGIAAGASMFIMFRRTRSR